MTYNRNNVVIRRCGVGRLRLRPGRGCGVLGSASPRLRPPPFRESLGQGVSTFGGRAFLLGFRTASVADADSASRRVQLVAPPITTRSVAVARSGAIRLRHRRQNGGYPRRRLAGRCTSRADVAIGRRHGPCCIAPRAGDLAILATAKLASLLALRTVPAGRPASLRGQPAGTVRRSYRLSLDCSAVIAR